MSPVARGGGLLRGPLPWRIAWRYLRGQRSRMLSSTALAALVATTLGVFAMVIAMALMSGYTHDLERQLIGLQGEIVLSHLDSMALTDDEAEGAAEDAGGPPDPIPELSRLEGVSRVSRVAYGEGALSGPGLPEGTSAVLRGVDPENDAALARLIRDEDPIGLLAPGDDGVPGILAGVGLARQLAASEGDPLRLVVLSLGGGGRPKFRYRSVRLAGTFETGFAEFDNRWLLIDRQVLAAARGKTGVDLVEIDLFDPADTEQVAQEVEALLGPEWIVQRWYRLNRELFAALRLQETMLFLVLGLIVLVSTFNIASTLVILVRERLTDVGVLAALGLAPSRLWGIFVVYGLGLGATGTLLGVALGSGISWIVTRYELIRFDPELAAIYFIDSVPFRVELADLAAIVVFTLVVTLLACALPALRAARIRPSEALRAE